MESGLPDQKNVSTEAAFAIQVGNISSPQQGRIVLVVIGQSTMDTSTINGARISCMIAILPENSHVAQRWAYSLIIATMPDLKSVLPDNIHIAGCHMHDSGSIARKHAGCHMISIYAEITMLPDSLCIVC